MCASHTHIPVKRGEGYYALRGKCYSTSFCAVGQGWVFLGARYYRDWRGEGPKRSRNRIQPELMACEPIVDAVTLSIRESQIKTESRKLCPARPNLGVSSVNQDWNLWRVEVGHRVLGSLMIYLRFCSIHRNKRGNGEPKHEQTSDYLNEIGQLDFAWRNSPTGRQDRQKASDCQEA